MVRQVATGTLPAEEDGPLPEVEAEFDELMHGPGIDPWEDFSQDAVLQRALAASLPPPASTETLHTPTRTTGAPPMTPKLGSHSASARALAAPVHASSAIGSPPLNGKGNVAQVGSPMVIPAMSDPYDRANDCGPAHAAV